MLNQCMRFNVFPCLPTRKGLSFDQVVESVLNDYARHVCLNNGWEVMNHADLSAKENGIYFYLEDVIDFAEKYHSGIVSREGKKIDDFKPYMVAIDICYNKPRL